MNVNTDNLTDDEILDSCAKILRTQPEHVLKTVRRFKREIGNFAQTKLRAF